MAGNDQVSRSVVSARPPAARDAQHELRRLGRRRWKRRACAEKLIVHAPSWRGVSQSEYFPFASGRPSTRRSRSVSSVVAQLAPGVHVSPQCTSLPKIVRPRTAGR
jgi:hypothetical protein